MNRMLGAAHGWRRCGDTDGRPVREARLPNMRTWRSREDREWTKEAEETMGEFDVTDDEYWGVDAKQWEATGSDQWAAGLSDEPSASAQSGVTGYWTPEREAAEAEHYRDAFRAANTTRGEVPDDVYARGWDAISAYHVGERTAEDDGAVAGDGS